MRLWPTQLRKTLHPDESVSWLRPTRVRQRRSRLRWFAGFVVVLLMGGLGALGLLHEAPKENRPPEERTAQAGGIASPDTTPFKPRAPQSAPVATPPEIQLPVPPPEPDPDETGSLPITPGESYAAYFKVSADTEAKALALTIQVQRKYASILAPRRLSYKGFKAGEGYDFRVRLARLTYQQAQEICRRVQEEGGACQIAPN